MNARSMSQSDAMGLFSFLALTCLLLLLQFLSTSSFRFDEFLVGLRGCLNGVRLAIVQEAYNKFDVDHDGKVKVNDLKACREAHSLWFRLSE